MHCDVHHAKAKYLIDPTWAVAEARHHEIKAVDYSLYQGAGVNVDGQRQPDDEPV
jgi:hypothetical protein